ncbi:hypothetical protein CMUS01_13931 [Colletotrichum musicola]|uniref:Uncharacterized protein n=1 Tax=Colletotrichum musicola TaxID=2175873 RepID=A0A8H6J832_9PEZI|nr:hypothetical protein CMUS01_13931 [Colletotrichum musicola]
MKSIRSLPSQPEHVEVIWKVEKPPDETVVKNNLKAHWKTAIIGNHGKIPFQIAIRSLLHDQTMTRHGLVPDDWHVTTSWLKGTTTFQTFHGYTKGEGNYDVVDTTSSRLIRITAKRDGKQIYPNDRKRFPREYVSVSYLNGLLHENS